jgi:hypothetical protein
VVTPAEWCELAFVLHTYLPISHCIGHCRTCIKEAARSVLQAGLIQKERTVSSESESMTHRAHQRAQSRKVRALVCEIEWRLMEVAHLTAAWEVDEKKYSTTTTKKQGSPETSRRPPPCPPLPSFWPNRAPLSSRPACYLSIFLTLAHSLFGNWFPFPPRLVQRLTVWEHSSNDRIDVAT